MGRINRTKLLDRQHDRRDVKLFIVATEGEDLKWWFYLRQAVLVT
jgi:hypothetical protein